MSAFLTTRAPENWNDLVDQLSDLTAEGEPLHGWFFHGTCGRQLRLDQWWWRDGIVHDGLRPAMEPEDGEENMGVYLGTPRIAAHFAYNRSRKSWVWEDEAWQDDRPCLIAVPGSALDLSLMRSDICMLENPVGIAANWVKRGSTKDRESCRRAHDDWQECYALAGSVLYRGSIAPQDLTPIMTFDDLELLLDRTHTLAPAAE